MIEFAGTTKTSIRWIDLPLIVQYSLKKKKLTSFIKGGIILNFFQNYTISQKQLSILNRRFAIDDERIFINDFSVDLISDNLRKIITELFIGLGIELNINSNFSIFTSLDYTYGVSPVYESDQITTFLDSFGLSIGSKFYF